MGRIIGYDHSLGQKNILKFVYYFMIYFYISLNIFIVNIM
jgi:hypothetical protein